MKKLLTLLAFGLSMSIGAAHAADAAAAPTQQSKMKTCNVDAKTKALKGPDRKAFMKSCLSNKPAAAEPAAATTATGTTQQSKMKTCNVDAKAKALKGPDRKAFMKSCLSNK